MARSGAQMQPSAKVFVNGSAFSGQSSLIDALQGHYLTTPIRGKHRTGRITALQLTDTTFSLFRKGSEGIPVEVWSSGGQSIFVNEFFADPSAVFVIVMDGAYQDRAAPAVLQHWITESERLGADSATIIYVVSKIDHADYWGHTKWSRIMPANTLYVTATHECEGLAQLRSLIADRIHAIYRPSANPVSLLRPLCPMVTVEDDIIVVTHPAWWWSVLGLLTQYDQMGLPSVEDAIESITGVRPHMGTIAETDLSRLLAHNYYCMFGRNLLVDELNANGHCRACAASEDAVYNPLTNEITCDCTPVTTGMCRSVNHASPVSDCLFRLSGNETPQMSPASPFIQRVSSLVWCTLVQQHMAFPLTNTEGDRLYYLPCLGNSVSKGRTPQPRSELIVPDSTITQAITTLFALPVVADEHTVFTRSRNRLRMHVTVNNVRIAFKEKSDGYHWYASPLCDIQSLLHL